MLAHNYPSPFASISPPSLSVLLSLLAFLPFSVPSNATLSAIKSICFLPYSICHLLTCVILSCYVCIKVYVCVPVCVCWSMCVFVSVCACWVCFEAPFILGIDFGGLCCFNSHFGSPVSCSFFSSLSSLLFLCQFTLLLAS